MTRNLGLLFAGSLVAMGLIACSQGSPQPDTGPKSIPITVEAPAATVPPVPGQTGYPPPVAPPAGPTATAPQDAAIVNGQPIPLADYQREVARARAYFIGAGVVDPNTAEGQQYLANVAQQVLEQQLIAQVLIDQAAAREGIQVTDEQVQQAIKDTEDQAGGKDALDAFLAEQGMTRDDLVKQQRDRLLTEALQDKIVGLQGDTADQVHARHLMVATREEAEKALARIKAGEDFAKVADEVSQDAPTSTQGGDLGWFPRGVMLPEIDTVAFSLPPGGLSDVFQSSAGWHVLQVLEHDPQHPLTDDQKQALRQKAFEDWLNAERERANVEIFVK